MCRQQPGFVTPAAGKTLVAGASKTLNIVTSGYPKTPIQTSGNLLMATGMSLTASGALPSGVVFSSTNSNGQNTGTGVFSGTPCASCAGD